MNQAEKNDRGESPVIIIKKIKKGHEGGHHGGAWKVAYADFVTAMMALFLVLWIVAMLSIDARKAVAEYFRSYTVFKGTEAGGAKGMSVMQGGPVKLDPESGDLKKGQAMRDKLTFALTKVVEEKLSDSKDQIMIFSTRGGVRIELLDKDKNPMFEAGKAALLPRGKEVLGIVSDSLREIPNNISIEGHTDSRPYPGENYSNWELAADRSNAARRELVKNGLDPAKISKVTSFADSNPIKPDDPFSSENRRVTILVEIKDYMEMK